MMRNFALVILLSFVSLSCGFMGGGKKKQTGRGDVGGQIDPRIKSKKWIPERPVGMVPIPSGSFVLGQSDFDFTYSPTKAPLTTVTVSAFFIDDSEVTNSKYRVFVNYVRDSLIRTALAEKNGSAFNAGNQGGGRGAQGIAAYAYKAQQGKEKTPYEEFLESQGGRGTGDYDPSKRLDWSVPLILNTSKYPDVQYAEVLESFYYPPEERFNNERTIDTRKLKFRFSWIDKLQAVKNKGRGKDFVKYEEVMVYPDTTTWLRDFNYSYNDPMFEQYFWHSAFEEYPVVGVTWDQARAYCAYKTMVHNIYNRSLKKKKDRVFEYRLPTETEWEYAARGGLQNAPYPWGGPYLTDDRGCYLANFKPKRGDYIEDKEKGLFLYTAKVKSFPRNGYGLYDMAGNVAEWTQSPYNNSSYVIASTMNPYLANKVDSPNKVVKGGSWKDIGFMLMVGNRDYEHKDSARSFIGFRTVQTIPESADFKFRKKRLKQ